MLDAYERVSHHRVRGRRLQRRLGAGGVAPVRDRSSASSLNRSEIYLEAFPQFTRRLVSILDHNPLLHELRLPERSTTRLGKDTIDHGRNGSDDYRRKSYSGTEPRIKTTPIDQGA